ncbi:MAG: hypothetical protein JW763_03855 [candidate division Zixibacteria bacterium]|nr:hypothetical protein [candidate division Zixibacteria bacterium]
MAGLILALLIGSLIVGCTTADRNKVRAGSEAGTIAEPGPGKGDAYLFDVKVFREGKKKSTRLDVYRTTDSLSFFARAYLGKGVMKALLVRDSALVYFPTENQYYAGPLNALVTNGCADRFAFEQLILDMFRILPVQIDYATDNFYVNVVREGPNERVYRLMSTRCNDAILLEYRREDGRYIPYLIAYARDDDSFRFEARRRTVRMNVDIPADKFAITIPETAVRIEP